MTADLPPDTVTQERLRTGFRWLNRRVMSPMLEGPLGAWVSSPVVGYLAVLTTTGRRSGLPRRSPLNYALRDGHAYLLAGFGERTDWLRNLDANPEVTLRLPGRTVTARAERVTDHAEAERAMVDVARSSGFALLLEGLNPLTVGDAGLVERFAGRPVVRVTPAGELRPGGHDPGGWLWTLPHLVLPGAAAVAGAILGARRRRARSLTR